jgi:hypothetical protein
MGINIRNEEQVHGLNVVYLPAGTREAVGAVVELALTLVAAGFERMEFEVEGVNFFVEVIRRGVARGSGDRRGRRIDGGLH